MGSKILMILQAPLGCLCNNNFHYSYTNHFALLKISSFSNQKSSSILVRNDLTNTQLGCNEKANKDHEKLKMNGATENDSLPETHMEVNLKKCGKKSNCTHFIFHYLWLANCKKQLFSHILSPLVFHLGRIFRVLEIQKFFVLDRLYRF